MTDKITTFEDDIDAMLSMAHAIKIIAYSDDMFAGEAIREPSWFIIEKLNAMKSACVCESERTGAAA